MPEATDRPDIVIVPAREPCPRCHGAGVRQYALGISPWPRYESCEHCDGTGSVLKTEEGDDDGE